MCFAGADRDVQLQLFPQQSASNSSRSTAGRTVQVVVDTDTGTIASGSSESRACDLLRDKQPLVSEHVSKLVDEDAAFDKVSHASGPQKAGFAEKASGTCEW